MAPCCQKALQYLGYILMVSLVIFGGMGFMMAYEGWTLTQAWQVDTRDGCAVFLILSARNCSGGAGRDDRSGLGTHGTRHTGHAGVQCSSRSLVRRAPLPPCCHAEPRAPDDDDSLGTGSASLALQWVTAIIRRARTKARCLHSSTCRSSRR